MDSSIDILVISDSWDRTSDLVIRRMGIDRCFRLNTDIIRDYVIDIAPQGFTISDPTGRKFRSSDVTSVYWRKPFCFDGYDRPDHSEAYFYSECRYVVMEIYNLCVSNGARSLVTEGAERRLGKLRQLQIAKHYFTVPKWRVTLGIVPETSGKVIAKSLSGEPVDERSAFYTTAVGGLTLDDRHLWLVQEQIVRVADLTVVSVDGSNHAFQCNEFVHQTDWRESIGQMTSASWEKISLSPALDEAITAFMNACDLSFGRLDFVSDGSEIHFLEVNPNGQWAWLDLNDCHGLISAVASAVIGSRRQASGGR